jgi:putative peptidoglycan lipid II flippase
MTGHAHRQDLGSLRQDLASSLRSIGIVLMFAEVALIVLAYPVARIFADSPSSTHNLAGVLIAYLIGLVPFSLIFVLQRTFYAMEDTRTPFFYQTLQSVLLVAGMLYSQTLPRDEIAIGIALSTTLANCITLVVSAVLLRRRLNTLGLRPTFRPYLSFTLALVPAAIVGILLDAAFGVFHDGFALSGKFGAVASVIIIGAIMALVYAAGLTVLRSPDFQAFIAPVTRRIRRWR